jgi:hypothetical protein
MAAPRGVATDAVDDAVGIYGTVTWSGANFKSAGANDRGWTCINDGEEERHEWYKERREVSHSDEMDE